MCKKSAQGKSLASLGKCIRSNVSEVQQVEERQKRKLKIVRGLNQSLESHGKKLGMYSSNMGSYWRVLSNRSHLHIFKCLGRVKTTY